MDREAMNERIFTNMLAYFEAKRGQEVEREHTFMQTVSATNKTCHAEAEEI